MKRLIKGLLVLVVFLSTALINSTFTKASVYEPTFESLIVSPTTIKLGGKVSFLLKPESNAYFLTSAVLEYEKPNGERESIVLSDSGDSWTGNYVPTNKDEVGTWKLATIHLEDDGGNVNDLSQLGSEQYNFTVEDAAGDILPPAIHSVTFKNQTVLAGELNEMVVNASDDVTGVQFLHAILVSPSGKTLDVSAFNLNSDGNWHSKFSVPLYTESGEWKVESIYVEDAAGHIGNYKYIDQYPESFSTFTVLSDQQDINAPAVEAVTFEKSSILAGNSNTAFIKIVDDVSGTQFVEAEVKNDPSKPGSYASCEPTGNLDVYKCDFSISPYAKAGEWKITRVFAQDNAGNIGDYSYIDTPYPSLFEVFSVLNENEDIALPTFQSLEFSKTNVKPGEDLTITISANDGISGIAYIGVGLESKDQEQAFSADEFYQQEDGTWKATVHFPSDSKVDEWSVGYIVIVDNAGNQWNRYYTPEGTFETSPDGILVKVDGDRNVFTVGEETITKPSTPSVTDINKTNVTGKAETNKIIEVYKDGKLLASGKTDENGIFTINFPKQKNRATLHIVAVGKFGNQSEAATISIKQNN